MTRFRTYLLLIICSAFSLALAQGGEAIGAVDSFLAADGYVALDVEELERLVEAQLPASTSVFTAGEQLSPLAKAMFALEAVSGAPERARHHLIVSLVPDSSFMLIQLDRFDLGPVLRQQLVDSIGEEHGAPLEEFGTGPDESLRLVTTWLMGNRAAIVGAARKEADAGYAAWRFCLLTPCASPEPSPEAEGPNLPLEPIHVGLAASYEPARDGLPTPAALLDLLAEQSGLVLNGNEGVGELTGESFVVAEALLESNLGQVGQITGTLRQGALLDDAVAATWHRLAAFEGWSAGDPLFGAAAFECRRGEPQDGLCP